MSEPAVGAEVADVPLVGWWAVARADLPVVVLAVAAWAGAVVAVPVPVPLAVVGAVAAWWWRRAWLLVAVVALLAAGRGASVWAATAPVAPRPFDGEVLLVTDPEDVPGGVRAVVADGEGRYELTARGRDAGAVRGRLAGERLAVTGRLEPRPDEAVWLARRHVVGRLVPSTVRVGRGADPPAAVANVLRRRLVAGAASLPDDLRPLFTGFVLGDDRGEAEDLAAAFRASGLTHLLVVSGENVAFLLALLGPLRRRLPLGGRAAVALVAVAFFALLTRFEPSVLRATAMAAIAVVAEVGGRPTSARRLLALAVAALVLADPLLVGSLAFQLSVAASAGIVELARPLGARLPGPRPVAEALGVTLAAQVAVAPLLAPLGGGLPLVTVPANLLAVPAAGPVMMWGLTGGLVAGVVGGPVAAAIHLPTRALLTVVAGVARIGARLPVGSVGVPGVVALAVLTAAAVACRRVRVRRRAAVALAGLVAVLAVPVRAPAPAGPVEVGGATVWRSEAGGVVVAVDGQVRAAPLLDGLHRDGVRRVDVLVVRTPSARAGAVAAVVRRWVDVPVVLGPDGGATGAPVLAVGTTLVVPGWRVEVTAVRPRLEVAVAADQADRGGPGDRADEPAGGAGSAPGGRAPPG